MNKNLFLLIAATLLGYQASSMDFSGGGHKFTWDEHTYAMSIVDGGANKVVGCHFSPYDARNGLYVQADQSIAASKEILVAGGARMCLFDPDTAVVAEDSLMNTDLDVSGLDWLSYYKSPTTNIYYGFAVFHSYQQQDLTYIAFNNLSAQCDTFIQGTLLQDLAEQEDMNSAGFNQATTDMKTSLDNSNCLQAPKSK